jgi:thiamine-monophosphate kinase
MSPRRPAGEDALLAWLRRIGGATTRGLGDDVALLRPPRRCAMTIDTQEEGVHFPVGLDPATIARRLLAVNLSDLAAAGARPRAALLALAAPSGFRHRVFFRALLAGCRANGMALAGGDLAKSDRVRAVLTVLGEAVGRPLRRSQARSGDRLWLGGSVGESAAGRELLRRGCRWFANRPVLTPELARQPRNLRRAAASAIRKHLAPQPQLELGAWLARRRRIAAIDLSDGLLLDLSRLCAQSAVGVTIDLETVPVSRGLRAVATYLGWNPTDFALRGGEDYVLLFAAPPQLDLPRRLGCVAIGRLERKLGLRILCAGKPLTLATRTPNLGWDHLAELPNSP